MDDCIFCKIANKEIPKEFTYEDEDVVVFPDLKPSKPIHLLIVPKKHIADFLDVLDPMLMQKMWRVAQLMAKQQGLSTKGFRVLINAGGAQIIQHLHIHLQGPLGLAVKD